MPLGLFCRRSHIFEQRLLSLNFGFKSFRISILNVFSRLSNLFDMSLIVVAAHAGALVVAETASGETLAVHLEALGLGAFAE
jgi:hypothetical protein